MHKTTQRSPSGLRIRYLRCSRSFALGPQGPTGNVAGYYYVEIGLQVKSSQEASRGNQRDGCGRCAN
eukprot:6423796-Prymnesium_polylepis.1